MSTEAQASTGAAWSRRDAQWTGTTRRTLPGRNWTKADVHQVDAEDGCWAVKDYAPRPWWVRRSLGRWLIGRERRALHRAAGIPGVPRLRPGAAAREQLITAWIEGTGLGETAELPAETWGALHQTVTALHERGLALGDLHRSDVRIDLAGRPWILDFATAWHRTGRFCPGRRGIFDHWCERDRIALARLEARARGLDERQTLIDAVGLAGWRRYERWRRRKRLWDRLRGRR